MPLGLHHASMLARVFISACAGEFTETKCHQGSITRLRLSWDEQLLATASDDGSIFVHDVRDRDAKAAARREQVRSISRKRGTCTN